MSRVRAVRNTLLYIFYFSFWFFFFLQRNDLLLNRKGTIISPYAFAFSKFAAKLLLFAQRIVVVFTTFNIGLQLFAVFVRQRGKKRSLPLRKHP